MTARGTGAAWENLVAAHLQESGLRLLQRNFTCRLGEIDLVMADRGVIVFVEVRFRRSAAHGDGIESIGMAKRTKLLRAARVWLSMHPKSANAPCRFDVIACHGTLQAPQFEWIRNAFDAC